MLSCMCIFSVKSVYSLLSQKTPVFPVFILFLENKLFLRYYSVIKDFNAVFSLICKKISLILEQKRKIYLPLIAVNGVMEG